LTERRGFRLHIRLAFVAVALSAVGMACVQSSNRPTPPPATLTGTWAGDFPVQGQTARMTWTLTQTTGSVNGPALVALPNGVVLANGVVTGTFADPALTFTITIGPGAVPAQPTCSGQLAGTATASFAAVSTLTGNYTATSSSCTTPFSSGNLTLTKQ
jgi:hypothetical protein